MLCEMCGSESAMLSPRKISGSVIRVCSSCGDLGSEPTHRESIGHRAYVAQTLQNRNMKRRYSDLDTEDKVLISNYGEGVRKAREKLGMNHAKELWKLGLEAVEEAKNYISKYKIDCAIKKGVMQAGYYPNDFIDFLKEIEHMEKYYNFNANIFSNL